MLDSKTIRQAAGACEVHRNTSFRWRHRFLKWAKDDRPTHLHGITEADETYLLGSDKGARQLNRAARKRGGHQTGTFKRAGLCTDRPRPHGANAGLRDRQGSVTKAQLRACLQPVLDDDVLLVSDANATYHYFAADAGITHESVNLSAGVRVKGAFHVQNVNAYHSRLHQWFARFHGVATRYLPNYLGWRRALDIHRLPTPQTLLRAAIGVFPYSTLT